MGSPFCRIANFNGNWCMRELRELRGRAVGCFPAIEQAVIACIHL